MTNLEFLVDWNARLTEEARKRRDHFLSNSSGAVESQRPYRPRLPPGTTLEVINGRLVLVKADDLTLELSSQLCAGSTETLCER